MLEVVNFLPDFIQFVIKAHKDFIDASAWKQKLWNVERGEKQLDWESYSTGNYKRFNNIIMRPERLDSLTKDVTSFLESEDSYKKRGVSWCRGYLFHGEPGCGKTSLVKAIANEAKMDIYCMDLSIIENDQEMRTMFRKIPAKALVLFEDIDTSTDIVKKRNGATNPTVPPIIMPAESSQIESIFVKKKTLSLSALLNELDGVTCNHGRVVIMTTNHIEVLDPALIRPGRIDVQMELKRANLQEISQAYKLYADKDVPTEKISLRLHEKFTVAQICNKILTGELDEELN